MGDFINQFKVNGQCCECECEKREGPCDCCDCCPDAVLPNSVCVYCVETNNVSNSSGCCTQTYRYCDDVKKLFLEAGTCNYKTAGGVKVLEYDTVAGFWKGTFCTALGEWPALGGCEHVTGKYYDENGKWTGGVVTGGTGNLPSEEWLDDCDCDKGDDNPYIYGHQCEEDDDDPCCQEENQICPEDEGVAFNPSNGICL